MWVLYGCCAHRFQDCEAMQAVFDKETSSLISSDRQHLAGLLEHIHGAFALVRLGHHTAPPPHALHV